MSELKGQIPEAGKTIQWIIEDVEQWSPEEIETVIAPIRNHAKMIYDKWGIVGNNYWIIFKVGKGPSFVFHASKITWEYGSCGGRSAEECATSIREYFGKE